MLEDVKWSLDNDFVRSLFKLVILVGDRDLRTAGAMRRCFQVGEHDTEVEVPRYLFFYLRVSFNFWIRSLFSKLAPISTSAAEVYPNSWSGSHP